MNGGEDENGDGCAARINGGKSGTTKKTRSTVPRRSRGKKGGAVLNRFIGLQATTIIFVSHSGSIVPGREAVE